MRRTFDRPDQATVMVSASRRAASVRALQRARRRASGRGALIALDTDGDALFEKIFEL